MTANFYMAYPTFHRKSSKNMGLKNTASAGNVTGVFLTISQSGGY